MNVHGSPQRGDHHLARWLGRGLLVGVVVAGSVTGTYLLIRSVESSRMPQRQVQPQPIPSGPSPFQDLPSGWTRLPSPPEARVGAAAAWTGDQIIVWGGYLYSGYSDESAAGDGFIFDARSRSWRTIAESPLGPRSGAASAWTGKEMLVWGGGDAAGEPIAADGAAYDPTTDSWRPLPPAPLDPRLPHSVWTGREFLIWGNASRSDRRSDGAAFDPITNRWKEIAKAPIALTDATAVWTGSEMVVFGAALHGGNFAETDTAVGAAYDPASDQWRRIVDSELSPQASAAAWDGEAVVAWDYENRTAAYDPAANRWKPLDRVPLDPQECTPDAVQAQGFIFGDYCGQMAFFDPSEGRWEEVRSPIEEWYSGWTLIPAAPAVVLLGRDVETGEQAMFAYRPR